MAEEAPKLTRRKLVLGGVGLGIGAAAIAIATRFSGLFKREIAPGTVHFEFGRHATREDANERVSNHLKSKTPPEHFVSEGEPYQFFYGTQTETGEFMKKAEVWHQEKERLKEQLNQGNAKLPPEATAEFSNPYVLRIYQLVNEANSQSHKVTLHLEPFNPVVAGSAFNWMAHKLYSMPAIEAGDFWNARDEYQKALENLTNANIVREKDIIKLLEKLHAEQPNARIVVEYGATHEHLADLTTAKGIKTTRNIIRHDPITPEEELISAWAKKAHGLAQLPPQQQVDMLFRRAFLTHILRNPDLGMPETEPPKIIAKLSDNEAIELATELSKTKQNLTIATANWLKQRGKI